MGRSKVRSCCVGDEGGRRGGAERARVKTVLEFWRTSGLPLHYTEHALSSATFQAEVGSLEWWKQSGLSLKIGNVLVRLSSFGASLPRGGSWELTFLSPLSRILLACKERPVCLRFWCSVASGIEAHPTRPPAECLDWWSQSGLPVRRLPSPLTLHRLPTNPGLSTPGPLLQSGPLPPLAHRQRPPPRLVASLEIPAPLRRRGPDDRDPPRPHQRTRVVAPQRPRDRVPLLRHRGGVGGLGRTRRQGRGRAVVGGEYGVRYRLGERRVDEVEVLWEGRGGAIRAGAFGGVIRRRGVCPLEGT